MEKDIKIKSKTKIIWRARKRLWCGLPWTFTVYSLSEDRLFVKRGMLNIHEDEVRLYRIHDVGMSATLLQRIFGLGTIRVCSTDSSLKDFEIKNIRNARDVKETLSDLVEEERQRKQVMTREILGHDGPEHMNDEDVFDFNEI